MTDLAIVTDMSAVEAEMCLLAIAGDLDSARQKMLDLDRRRGWAALGYTSAAACFADKLGVTRQHADRKLAAYEVEDNISALLPLQPVAITERTVRDSGIGKLEPRQQAEAYAVAQRLQVAAQDRQLQKRHIVAAVNQIVARDAVYNAPYPAVSEMVAAGKLTAVAGRQMVESLDKLLPRQRDPLLQLIAIFGLTSSALVGPLGSLFGRKAGNESLMLPEVQTGYLGGVALAQATLTDWGRAAEEAQWQHMASRLNAEADKVQPLIVTVYKGDVNRTVKALKEALGDEVYNIRDRLMEE